MQVLFEEIKAEVVLRELTYCLYDSGHLNLRGLFLKRTGRSQEGFRVVLYAVGYLALESGRLRRVCLPDEGFNSLSLYHSGAYGEDTRFKAVNSEHLNRFDGSRGGHLGLRDFGLRDFGLRDFGLRVFGISDFGFRDFSFRKVSEKKVQFFRVFLSENVISRYPTQ